MSTAIIIDDSFSTTWNPNDYDDRSDYTLRAEIAIGEAYLRQDPDADIIGLVAGPVSDLDDLFPQNGTPVKNLLQAVQDYDQVVLIMDAPLSFNDIVYDQDVNDLTKSLNNTEVQIIIVGEVGMIVNHLGHLRYGLIDRWSGNDSMTRIAELLVPHLTMIVDPRSVLDFGF